MDRRWFLSTMISLIALLATGSSLAEEEQDEYAVKAGYLYHFCNYVRWPSDVASDSRVIGVIGPALNAPDILETIRELNGQIVGNRKIKVCEFASADKYEACDIIFVTGQEPGTPDLLAKIVELSAKKPVLVVSEQIDGLNRGAIINFVRVGKSIKLEIRNAAANKVSLVLNAKLLRLAINSAAQ